MHSANAAQLVADSYTLPAKKLCVGQLGNYLNAHPNEVNRTDARAALGYSNDVFLFLVLGQLRPYKGIDRVLSAFARVGETCPQARLLIAGQAVSPIPAGKTSADAERIPGARIVEGRLADGEVQLNFNA